MTIEVRQEKITHIDEFKMQTGYVWPVQWKR